MFEAQISSTHAQRGISIPVAAIEVGFGDLKWAYRNSLGNIIRESFPSLCPTYTESNLSKSIGVVARKNFIVEVDGQKYEVGPEVEFALGGQTNNGRNLNEDFPKSNHYEALVLGAISHMTANDIQHLVLGLPVHTIGRYAEFLKMKFTGTFKLHDRTVAIHKVSVLPQPIGTLLRCAADEKLSIKNDVSHLIIDPGYFTTDWIVANGFRTIDSRSDGTVSGVSQLLKDASILISKDLDVKFERFERLGRALKKNEPLTIFNKTLSIQECWNYIKRCQPIIDECLNKIVNKVGDMDDIRSIILTGGGSVFYEATCKERFKSIPVVVLAQAPFANVVGFVLAGENATKQK